MNRQDEGFDDFSGNDYGFIGPWVGGDLGSSIKIPIIIKSLIYPYKKSAEGKLIKAVSIPWNEIVQFITTNPIGTFEIKSRVWEEIIAGAFETAGYDEVTLTPHSGDKGRDLIAVKNGIGSIRILVSVKAYNKNRLVEYDDIRSLLGVLQADHLASKAILTTTSDFPTGIYSDQFIAPFIPYKLELMNGKLLIDWLKKLAKL